MSSRPFTNKPRTLALDTNILVRAVLGQRVRSLFMAYADRVSLVAPEFAFVEVRARLPGILARRRLPPSRIPALFDTELLDGLQIFVTPVASDMYARLEREARRRLAGRDEADWPFLALALMLDSPLWTEDRDFFGTGIATWTTDRVEIYLSADS